MGIIFEIIDKNNKKIKLTDERYNHIKKHPNMNDSIERIKSSIKNPIAIRYNEFDETVIYYYKEFKDMGSSERYLLVSIKYLNGNGFIITSFYTNKITGSKWKV